MQDEDIPRSPGASLGRVIRHARRHRAMSQEAVALESGLQRKTVYMVERGKSDPRLGTLERIASAVEVELPDLLARRRTEDHYGAGH